MRAREAKEALEHVTRDFLSSFAQAEVGENLSIDRQALRVAPKEIALRALSKGLRYIHDDPYPPEYGSLNLLYKTVREESGEHIQTLYGCMASVSEKRVVLLREPSAAVEILPLQPGKTVLWDNRWFVSSESTAFLGDIRALGCPPHEVVDRFAPDLRRRIPQGRVRASLPAIWDNGVLRAIPSFEAGTLFRMQYRKEAFP